MGANASTLPDKMSFDGAGLTAAPGEGVPRRLKADFAPPTTCKFDKEIDNVCPCSDSNRGYCHALLCLTI